MNIDLGLLISFSIQALVACLVWSHYRGKLYSLREKYSTFWPRFWTSSVDACVVWPVHVLTNWLLTFEFSPKVSAILVLVENLVWLVYTVAMHSRYGQTLGKMVCQIRVVDFATETAISFRQALLREGIPIALSLGIVLYEFILIASGRVTQRAAVRGEWVNGGAFWVLAVLPTLWFVAEVVTMLTNEKRRALHDCIAGTVVVRTNVA